jgi:4-diphosphocytidyl-2-C-methyl-D-erythritol kinase
VILTTRALAKVNLVLRVGARRPDGFHDLQSLMVPIDLADEVEVRVARGRPGPVSCRCPGRPELDGPDNLAARAAEGFRRRFGVDDRCDIRIQKRIPVTAGLGGGSSDAAAVLRCLARAFEVRDREALAEEALAVGSDVPFFLGAGPAWARGRGEKLTPAVVPSLALVLAYPRSAKLAIRAADAYRWLDAARGDPANAQKLGPIRRAGFKPAWLDNDLQESCIVRFPEIENMIELLEAQGAGRAIMSGSGPTVFGLFGDRNATRSAVRAIARDRAEVASLDLFVVRTMQRQPGVASWKSQKSASSPSMKRSSRPT